MQNWPYALFVAAKGAATDPELFPLLVSRRVLPQILQKSLYGELCPEVLYHPRRALSMRIKDCKHNVIMFTPKLS
jgi:hypothetical protein